MLDCVCAPLEHTQETPYSQSDFRLCLVFAMKSLATRIAGTIMTGVVWFAFIVLYLAFFAEGYNLWQKAAIFLASGAIAGGVVAVLWIKWVID